MGNRKGRGVRARQKEKRKAAKKARKEAQKALYASWRDAGKNKKSKRYLKAIRGSDSSFNTRETILVPVKLKGAMVLAPRKVHGGPKCGNVGCKKCSSVWIYRAA